MQIPLSAQIFNVKEAKNDHRFKSEVLILDVNQDQLSQTITNRNTQLQITLPFFDSQKLVLNLEELKLHTDGFQLVEHTDLGKQIVPYELGNYLSLIHI